MTDLKNKSNKDSVAVNHYCASSREPSNDLDSQGGSTGDVKDILQFPVFTTLNLKTVFSILTQTLPIQQLVAECHCLPDTNCDCLFLAIALPILVV